MVHVITLVTDHSVHVPYTSVRCDCPIQAQKEPPPELMRRIVEADADRYAKRSKLGKNSDKWTPFAAKAFEHQRDKSKGYVVHSFGGAVAPSLLPVFVTQDIDVENRRRQR